MQTAPRIRKYHDVWSLDGPLINVSFIVSFSGAEIFFPKNRANRHLRMGIISRFVLLKDQADSYYLFCGVKCGCRSLFRGRLIAGIDSPLHMENYSKTGRSNHSVLVVNDLSDQLKLMDSALRQAGYQVFCVEDGQAAIEAAKRVRPDLIISDVPLPKTDGLEFSRLVREDQQLKTLPILLVSGLRSNSAVGTDEYLETPFDADQLVAQAARLIERAKLEDALRNSEERYRLLDEEQRRMHASIQQSAIEWRQTFNAIDFPVLIVDLDGHITRLNQAAHEIADRRNDVLVGQKIAAAGAGEPWQTAADLIRKIRDHDSARTAECQDRACGKVWAITVYLIHEFGALGERAILIAQDITQRSELEASVRRSEMMSMLGSLVAGVAHEVRNPLFGISSILDAFETRFSERTEYVRYINVLRDELARLNILMEELLEYGKPYRGELYLSTVDDVVTKSLRSCIPIAAIARVKLVNNVTGRIPLVLVDRRRLSKVFVNLIENAIQHSPAGETVQIAATEFREGNQVWLDCAVKDAGTGVLPEDAKAIFEPFFSKRRGGTGLGLAIAKKIMEEHGGQLLAGNNPEGGACMVARFPVPDEGK
jgi:signal transduction histidine kinase